MGGTNLCVINSKDRYRPHKTNTQSKIDDLPLLILLLGLFSSFYLVDVVLNGCEVRHMLLILAASGKGINASPPSTTDCSKHLSESSAMKKRTVASWPPPWDERSKIISSDTGRYNPMKALDKFFWHIKYGICLDFSGWSSMVFCWHFWGVDSLPCNHYPIIFTHTSGYPLLICHPSTFMA